MQNLKYVFLLLLSSMAFGQNQTGGCVLNTAHDGDTITIHGEAVQQAHDLAFAIEGCKDLVILTYAGDRESGVTADQLQKSESLKEFQKYTSSTYKSRGKNICMQCMKYGDVKATLTGRLQVATIPAGTTKDNFGFLHDASGKVVGTSGFGHPTRRFKYRLVIMSAADVKAHKLPRPSAMGKNEAHNIDPQIGNLHLNGPQVIHAEKPVYPPIARVAHVFGTVEVQVTVTNGIVTATEIKSGQPILVRAATANIKTWRFQPDVNTTFTTKFKYQIETKKTLQTDPQIELQLPYSVTITTVPPLLDTQSGQTAQVSTDTVDMQTGNLHLTVPLVATTKPSR